MERRAFGERGATARLESRATAPARPLGRAPVKKSFGRRVTVGVLVLGLAGAGATQIDRAVGDPLHLAAQPGSSLLGFPNYHGVGKLDVSQFTHAARQAPDTPQAAAGPVAPEADHGPITNLGGRAPQTAPTINVVFWGGTWNSHPDLMAQVLTFYSRLHGSEFSAKLAQYGNAAANPSLATAWVDPQAPTDEHGNPLAMVTQADVQAQIDRITKLTGLTTNSSSQVILVLPDGVAIYNDGINPTTELALGEHGAHSTGATWTLLRWDPRQGANIGESFTYAAAHEFAEAATDPNPKAATFGDASTGQEVADICETLPGVVSHGIDVSRFFSQADGACVAPPLDGGGLR